MTAPEAVPAVLAVEVLEGGQAARLSVEGGGFVFLSPDVTPRASFLPVTAHGFAVLLEDWKKEGGPAYRVPASVFDAVARFFDGQRPAEKRPLSDAWKKDPATLPHVVNVEALPEGVARLHLADGQRVEVEDAAPSFLSPDEYAPALLCIEDGQAKGFYVVPDALRLTVRAALGYAPPHEDGPPTLEGASLEGLGRAVLSLRLPDGQPYAYRLAVPVAYALSGRRSDAIQGKPYTLTLDPEARAPVSLACPEAVWPRIMPTLAKGGQP